MFGKRVTGPQNVSAPQNYSSARPDAQDASRVLPSAVWQGPHGNKLRELGFLPDDPANLMLTAQRMRAMEDAATSQMNALVAKVNAHLPNVTVVPWAVIPWSVWEDANAAFLIRLDFLPSSPWNNMLLAADARSSDFLGLPLHPRAALPGLHEQLQSMVDALRSDTSVELEQILAAISRGDFSLLDRYQTFKNEQFQKLFALTRYVQDNIFGASVCARHDELFGIGLSEVTG